MKNTSFVFLFWLIALLFIGCESELSNTYPQSVIKTENQSSVITFDSKINLVKLIDSLQINKNKIQMVVTKSHYRMDVVYDTTILKSYPVVFGFNALDDKLQQGDGCTPEGTFLIRSKYPHSSWSKFMWIDYPNKDSWVKHYQAKKDGKIPKNASIGGEVGIHGVPKGYDFLIDERENWTLGCISLKNNDVDELYQCIGARSLLIVKK